MVEKYPPLFNFDFTKRLKSSRIYFRSRQQVSQHLDNLTPLASSFIPDSDPATAVSITPSISLRDIDLDVGMVVIVYLCALAVVGFVASQDEFNMTDASPAALTEAAWGGGDHRYIAPTVEIDDNNPKPRIASIFAAEDNHNGPDACVAFGTEDCLYKPGFPLLEAPPLPPSSGGQVQQKTQGGSRPSAADEAYERTEVISWTIEKTIRDQEEPLLVVVTVKRHHHQQQRSWWREGSIVLSLALWLGAVVTQYQGKDDD